MKLLTIGMLTAGLCAVVLLSAGPSEAQDCVILKRMGPADQITSHMYSFGIRGKQFQYVEGPLPKGIKFHGRLTDNDVRKIQEAGGRFVVLEPKFTGADLAEARKGCIANFSQGVSETSETLKPASSPAAQTSSQPVRKASDSEAPQPVPTGPSAPTAVSQPSVRPAVVTVQEPRSTQLVSPAPASEGTVSITSDIEGAEIFIDSVGSGRAPMIVKLPAGRHSIQLVLAGRRDWTSEIDLKGNSIVNVSATFQANQ